MNQQNLKLCSELIDEKYIKIASNSLNAREKILKVLLSQRCLPEQGLDDLTIEYLLNVFATMDTNNFINKVGVGERESRIYSNLVEKRNYFMGHGIGRSGDLVASQPKAAGSSLIAKLTKHLAKDALSLSNYQIKELLVVPVATGMALTLCLLTLKQLKPNAKYVLWPRIDQKTCLKCIQTANLIPIVIDTKIEDEAVTTDLDLLEQKIQQIGSDNIICVLSTTSCFAPRIPDNISQIAKICKQYSINHIVNNAYGIQCNKIANSINQGLATGVVDMIVSSTDKNFMVPVGGSIIYGNDKKLIKSISELYPGRASAAPILDLFITLLSMGKDGYLQLQQQRIDNYAYFIEKLQIVTQKVNERVLNTKKNSISIAISLSNLQFDEQKEQNEATKIGAILYSKKIMGSRVVTNKKVKKVCGIEFKNYGSNCDNYFTSYMTVACAIGMTKKEIDQFLIQFDKIYTQQN